MTTRELQPLTRIPTEFLDNGRLMSRPITTSCGHIVQQIANNTQCSNCSGNFVSSTPNIVLAERIKEFVSTNFTQLSSQINPDDQLFTAPNMGQYWSDLTSFILENKPAVNIQQQDEEAGLLTGERRGLTCTCTENQFKCFIVTFIIALVGVIATTAYFGVKNHDPD